MTGFPFDIVGFDLDGTLLDTHADLGAAVNHALAGAGRAIVPVENVRDLVGGGSKRMLARALEATGGPVGVEEFDRLHAILIAYYEDHISVHSQVFPGVAKALDTLAGSGVKLAVVTNKLERLAVKLLEEVGLSDRFFSILGGDSLGPGKGKPGPDLLQAMVARGGGGRTAYVGDSSYDTLAAQAAGIPCIAVGFGFNDGPVEELGAAAVIAHYDELIATLKRL